VRSSGRKWVEELGDKALFSNRRAVRWKRHDQTGRRACRSRTDRRISLRGSAHLRAARDGVIAGIHSLAGHSPVAEMGPLAHSRGCPQMGLIRRSLTSLGVFTGHPIALLVVATYGVLWVVFDRGTFGWHGFAVLATWFMTLLIQRAEYRDTQAIQVKLDELLRAQARASNHLTQIDEEEPEDIERHREQARRAD
jgi:low affinity Fe/Cu permease